jgi:RNA-directed DNA polymerase
MSGKSLVPGQGESYHGVVPTKQPNQSGEPPAEVVEGRPWTKENTLQSNPHRTPSRESGPSGLERVRKTARKDGKLKFTALLHHVTVELLRESYFCLKRQAAPGVDGVTWQEYGEGLGERLVNLHGRIHRGAYRAQPSRRVWIPKPDGRQRPLGVAALEDKVVQHAVGKVLNQIWEEDFRGFPISVGPTTKRATSRCAGRRWASAWPPSSRRFERNCTGACTPVFRRPASGCGRWCGGIASITRFRATGSD